MAKVRLEFRRGESQITLPRWVTTDFQYTKQLEEWPEKLVLNSAVVQRLSRFSVESQDAGS